MSGLKVAAVATQILLLATSPAHSAAGDAIKYETWTGACQLAAELSKIQNIAAKKITDATETASSYLRQYFKTRILLEKTQRGNYKPAQLALLAYYAKKADDAAVYYNKANVLAQATAIRDSARLEGAIIDFVGALNQIVDGTHNCLQKGSADNNHRPAAASFDGIEAGCNSNTAALTGQAATISGFTAAGYSGALGAEKDENAITGGGTPKCTITAPKATNRLLNQGAGTTITGTPRYAGGIFYLHTNGLKQAATDQLTTEGPNNKMLAAAHRAYLATQHTVETFKFKDSTQLKEDPDFIKLYKKIVLKDKEPTTEADTALKNQIEAAFGPKEEMGKTYNSGFSDVSIINPQAADPPTLALTALTSIEQLTAVLQFYETQNRKFLTDKIAELEEKINKGASKTQEKICNDIGDKNETGCKNTPGCHLVSTNPEGTKCTVNPAATKTVNEATGKGAEGTTASDRCTKHGSNKEACEKENTPGQTPVCGFRKGKEGETDEPDKEKCRNGSFLVTKKFALSVVSAAFVALLF
uniref:Variant surface glycoprotein n=1 Tax=Trypanosoma brucei TaxID=5691 RepID=A0A1V0FXS3_9TRYP|nr:variant surface glycoprotein [Trypanosoma brucei]